MTIDQVIEGSAAERDGLQAGDLLMAAAGTDLGDDPMAVLGPLLQDGTPIEFRVQRGSEQVTITVRPNPKK